jgi:hypothetical protein
MKSQGMVNKFRAEIIYGGQKAAQRISIVLGR